MDKNSQNPGTELKKLTTDQLDKRKEIYIPINWRGFREFWEQAFYEVPIKTYQGIARAVDGFTDKMMVGKTALLGMPVGIMARNGARSAHQLSEGRYSHTAQVLGGISALAGAGFGVYTYFGAVSSAITAGAASIGLPFAGVLGAAGAVGVAGVGAVLAAVPLFTFGMLATATAISLGITAVSIAPAVLNVGRAWPRMKDAFRGVKYTEKDLAQAAAERDSLQSRYARKAQDDVTNGLYQLTPEARGAIGAAVLRGEFGEVAVRPTTVDTPAEAVPSAMPKAPKMKS